MSNNELKGHSIPLWANVTGEQASKLIKQENSSVEERFRSKRDEGWVGVDASGRDKKNSVQIAQFAQNLKEDYITKIKAHLFLEKNDLPRYKKVVIPLSKFRDNFPKEFHEFQSQIGLYFPQLINQKTGERSYVLNKTKEETKKYILEFLKDKSINIEDYILVLSEFWTNHYGGNVVINEEGIVQSVEIMQGEHTPLTKGQGSILMSAKNDPFMGILRLTFNKNDIDDGLKNQLQKSINHVLDLIPRTTIPVDKGLGGRFQETIADDLGRPCKKILTPGYFEFVLSENKEKGGPKFLTFFIDARVNGAAEKYQF